MAAVAGVETGKATAAKRGTLGGLGYACYIEACGIAPSNAAGRTAIVKAVDKIVAKGRKIAAHLLEASEADIEFKDGVFRVAGTDKQVPFAGVSLAAYVPHNYPLDKLEPGLNENAFYDPTNFTFPAGTSVG